MRKWIAVMNVLVLLIMINVFPLWTKTYGTQDISAGSTPPMGVVRDGVARFITNWNHVGLLVIVQGAFVVVYQQTKKTSHK